MLMLAYITVGTELTRWQQKIITLIPVFITGQKMPKSSIFWRNYFNNHSIDPCFQNKPVILVAHQFAGDAIANFNATVRQLKVGPIVRNLFC
jgi:hypothetical protein